MVEDGGLRMRRKAVFLDRDGVIAIPEFRNGRSFAARTVADFRLYPEAATSLHKLKRAGFVLAVVTNQPDVGLGLIHRSEVDKMHAIIARELPVDAIKACFHQQSEGCACRKPKPGMLIEAAEELGIDVSQSFMVGDRASDVEAGRAAGCATVFIDLAYDAELMPKNADYVVGSIAQAADIILNATREQIPISLSSLQSSSPAGLTHGSKMDCRVKPRQ
jgi:D-glycero-D-manno-heptose 1,7-bisphosphate phosphatase